MSDINKKRLRESPGTSSASKRGQTMSDKQVGNMTVEQLMTMFSTLLDNKLASVASKEDIQQLDTKVVALENQNRVLNGEIKKLTLKLNDLEDRSRRNNVIFRGFKDLQNESCVSQVKSFCKDILGITYDIHVNRAHLLGRSNSVIIAHLPVDDDIAEIFKNVKKLKNTGFVVQRDFTELTRQRRSKLFSLKREIEKVTARKDIRLGHDFLKIDNLKFFWCEEENLVTGSRGSGVEALKRLLRYDFTAKVEELASREGRRSGQQEEEEVQG
ncbi:hypothetical protein LSTR_LSTR001111 [Laodelphax striatellus]|uniref:Uncharacterized protein n=1 Tax=Laodelphax striatellus TaxID=195883 RepID=A0A482X2H5_LAOST|nr:hypothetical protein LSTR_LSTR001111 [Laodelphax striatellus]